MFKQCPQCSTVAEASAKFCRRCGSKLTQQPTAYCPECGKKCSPNDLFCLECGFDLHRNDSARIQLSDEGSSAMQKFQAFEEMARFADFHYTKTPRGEIVIVKLINQYAIDIEVPDGAVTIADGAFESSAILTVTLPEGLKSIGCRAFANCKNLTSVNIPSTVKLIDKEAFDGDERLDMEIPKTVSIVQSNVLRGTLTEKQQIAAEERRRQAEKAERLQAEEAERRRQAELAEQRRQAAEAERRRQAAEAERLRQAEDKKKWDALVYTQNNNGTIVVTGLKNKSIQHLEIPNGATSISKDAFSNCKNLVSVTIPGSVTSIGMNAFAWCDNLTTVTIPRGVITIGDSAFWKCEKLTQVTIPDTVTTLEKSAFWGCIGLTSMTIPRSVTTIGNDVFKWCKNLTSVKIMNSQATIGKDVFYGCPNVKVIR